MANELIAILDEKDWSGKASDLTFEVFNSLGVRVGAAAIASNEIGATGVFRGNMPTGQPAGLYSYRLEKDEDEAVAFSRFGWTGSAVISEAQFAMNTTAVPRFDAIDTAIANIQAMSQQDAQDAAAAAITAAGLATAAGVAATQSAIIAAIGALNDISTTDVLAQVTAALNTYDAPTEAELQTAVTTIVNEIGSNAGLSPAQDIILTFLRDVAEADENYTPTKAQKLLKGTATVLVDKDVTSTSDCNVTTTLVETP